MTVETSHTSDVWRPGKWKRKQPLTFCFIQHRLINESSDLSTALSNLNLNLQDQKERQSLRSHYAPQQEQQSVSHEPMPAPTPTRAPQPEPGVWNPAQGIKFGGPPSGLSAQQPQQANGNVHHPAYPNANARGGGQWDVSRGVRFEPRRS